MDDYFNPQFCRFFRDRIIPKCNEFFIFVCSHCGGEKHVIKEPVTTTVCTYWSDGKIDCCNDSQISYIQRCPHCGKYYYIIKNEARTGFGEAEDDGCLDIGEYAAICSNEALMSTYEPGMVASLFMQYVQQYNDVYRRYGNTDRRATYEQSKMFTKAVLFLTAYCRIPEVQIADLYRQAGMFKKCIDYASDHVTKVKEEEREILDKAMYLAIKGETSPFVTHATF